MPIVAPIHVTSLAELARVVETNWGHHPQVFRFHSMPGRPTSKEVFSAMLSAAEDYRKSPTVAVPFRAWMGNGLLECDLDSVLPSSHDQNVQGYVDRVLGLHGNTRGFSVMLNHLHFRAAPLFTSFAPFIQSIVQFSGIPVGGVDFDVIVGKYRNTGFGVHLDDADNFTFVLEGRKTIYAWPAEYASVFQRRRSGIANAKDESLVLEAGPGDIIYWPKSFWHVGESPEVSLTVQIAFYGVDTLLYAIGKAVAHAVTHDAGVRRLVESHQISASSARQVAAACHYPYHTRKMDGRFDDLHAPISSWLAATLSQQRNTLGSLGINIANDG